LESKKAYLPNLPTNKLTRKSAARLWHCAK